MTNQPLNIIVTEPAAEQRLDLFLAQTLAISRSSAQKMLAAQQVAVNGRIEPASYKTHASDALRLTLPADPSGGPIDVPQLPVIYRDQDVVIIDKPAGLIVHPGSGTTAAATVADFARTVTTDADAERPGIVHRLDRGTSGLLIIARTPASKHFLQAALASHRVHKTYVALVIGRIDPATATIDLPLGRNPRQPLQQAVIVNGRPAQTKYQTLAVYPGYTYIQAEPLTGRTHQLRVHFAATGHPIAGDTTYGPPHAPTGLHRQFLHATRLQLIGPHGQSIAVTSPLPPELQDFLSRLDNLV